MTIAHGHDDSGDAWVYTDIVKDHFFNPRNFLVHGQEENYKADGVGRVGSPACGDEMVIWIKVKDDPSMNSGQAKIIDCKWQTFGCGSAIASTSVLSEMVLENGGMKIEDAMKLRPQDILERLGGLPARKVHCSVLGDQALRAAIEDYKNKKK
jgi:NifU-like protein involved in Fe-S cluster formation